VLLVGYPVPEDLAARSPRLAWAHRTQAGVSNLAGTDLWGSKVTLTSSRGAVAATAIAEYALVQAVTTGRIRGAVLDVYAGELSGQPPRPELTALPQILLTPNISASGDTNMAGPLRRLFAENLRRYLDGQPLLNVVDRARGY
jgi:phosphoglycerate dehydrogenase-like enzyme